MCIRDEKITPRLREGVKIVAPPVKSLELAIKLLENDIGYQLDIDDIEFETEYHRHYTTVRYNKTMTNVPGLGTVRRFIVKIPNRYRLVEEDMPLEGVIYSEEDI